MKASFKFWVAARGYCLSCNATRLERLQLYYKKIAEQPTAAVI